jgi:beta-carotene 15,15'-dioxygenase
MHQRHRCVAIAVATAAILVSLLGWSPTPGVALALAAAAASVGLPHGALDVAIGPALMDRRLYFALYGVLAVLMIGLWFLIPPLALALFFAMSWFHFGSGDALGDAADHAVDTAPDRRTARLHGVATGGLVVGMPLAAHATITSQVLDPLMLGRSGFGSATAVAWGTVILAVALPATLMALIGHLRRGSWALAGELMVLALLGVVAHPLISFAVYFVAFHSPRHLIEMAPSRSTIAPTALASLATIGGAAAMWFALEPSAAATIQIVFIGLAALTVPHLVTTCGLTRARHAGLDRKPDVRDLVAIRLPVTATAHSSAA